MARYRCPNCHDEVDTEVGGVARVTWCSACGQPLTMLDLLPVRISPTDPEAETSLPEEPAALA